MGAFGAVRHWPLPVLFDGVVGESLPVGMLTVPDRLRNSITESNHVVLPVSNVIPELLSKNGVPLVISVKVEVEGVHQASPVVIDDDGRAHSAIGFTISVGGHPFKPRRILGDVVDRR